MARRMGLGARVSGRVVATILLLMITTAHYNFSGGKWLILFATAIVLALALDRRSRDNSWREWATKRQGLVGQSLFLIGIGLILEFAPRGSDRVLALNVIAAAISIVGALGLASRATGWVVRRARSPTPVGAVMANTGAAQVQPVAEATHRRRSPSRLCPASPEPIPASPPWSPTRTRLELDGLNRGSTPNPEVGLRSRYAACHRTVLVGPAQFPRISGRGFAGGLPEGPHRADERAPATLGDAVEHRRDRLTTVLDECLDQAFTLVGECEDQVAAIDRGFRAPQQATRYEAITGPGGVGGMDVHRLGQRVEVQRASAGNQHEHPKLRQRDPVLDLGNRLRCNSDQRLRREHDRIDLLRGSRRCIRLLITCPHGHSISR